MQVMVGVTLILDNTYHLELNDFLYVPKSRKNLISVSNSNKCNYSIYFNKRAFIRKNNSIITLIHWLIIYIVSLHLIFYLLLKIIKSH